MAHGARPSDRRADTISALPRRLAHAQDTTVVVTRAEKMTKQSDRSFRLGDGHLAEKDVPVLVIGQCAGRQPWGDLRSDPPAARFFPMDL